MHPLARFAGPASGLSLKVARKVAASIIVERALVDAALLSHMGLSLSSVKTGTTTVPVQPNI